MSSCAAWLASPPFEHVATPQLTKRMDQKYASGELCDVHCYNTQEGNM